MALQPFEKRVLRFLLHHLLVGLGGAVAFVAALFWLDLFGLWALISRSEEPVLWVLVLFSSVAVTFGSVGMGIGIMMLGEERDDPPQRVPRPKR